MSEASTHTDVLPKSSVSIRIEGDKAIDSPDLAVLEAKYGSKLDQLDINGDGKVDRQELLTFLRDTVDQEKQLAFIKKALVAAIILLILFALAVFGVVWAVVVLTKEVSTQDSPAGEVLVAPGTSNVLRTTLGSVALLYVPYNETAGMLYANTTIPLAQQMLPSGSNQSYVGDVSGVDVVKGCDLMLDGSQTITLFIPTASDTSGSQGVAKVDLNTVSREACQQAVDSKNAAGVSAVLLAGDPVQPLWLNCPQGSETCQVFTMVSPPSSSTAATSTAGRRLRSDGTPSLHSVGLSFGDALSVFCTEGSCGDALIDQQGNGAHRRRQLLQTPSDGVCNFGANYVQRDPDCGNDPNCFPASSYARLADGSRKKMSDLHIGDTVLTVDPLTGTITPSPIYVMPHANINGNYVYKEITITSPLSNINTTTTRTRTTTTIKASPDHYMLITPAAFNSDALNSDTPSWAHRKPIPAGKVQPGDRMWVLTEPSSYHISTVIAVDTVLEQGQFAPLTLTGTIIVDDVVASVYSTMLGSEQTMHAFTAWGRWLWRLMPQFFVFMHKANLASPVAMRIGYVARSLLRVLSLTSP